MRVLVVDDEEVALAAIRTVLEESGYDVVVARDGAQALEALRKHDVRLVISDWVMPRVDGLELCRRIRKEEFPTYIYVILLTSQDGVARTVEGLSAGADDFIAKPFHPAELRVRVRAAERVLALETRELAIFAMAKLVESRDAPTGAHLERVRSYSRILAQHLAEHSDPAHPIDADFVRLIYLTSPLHDIGKVGVPDCVLLKPGRLNDREFEIIKTHTTIGAQMLDAALQQYPGAKFLRMARDIALTHHERFDGTGYPNGLAGEAIPLCGRIVALADVYDALTSQRTYKSAFSHDIARNIVLDEAAAHFDPAVVNAFLDREGEFIEVRDRCEVGAELALA